MTAVLSMAILLFLVCAFITVGVYGLFVALLDYRDARALAAFRAEQLVAAARQEVRRG